jgi:hypothetical protein
MFLKYVYLTQNSRCFGLFGETSLVGLIKNSNKKNFDQKIKFLAHSENLKFAKIHLLHYFQPLWAKNIPKL